MRGHLHSNDLAAYIDRTLDDDARAQLEDHLADCAACRAELIGAHRVVRSRPLHRRPIVLGPLVAAVVLVLFMVMLRGPTSNAAQPVLRTILLVVACAGAFIAGYQVCMHRYGL